MVPFVRISSYSRESVVTACVSTVSFSYASVLLSPPTRSIFAWILPSEMNRASSLLINGVDTPKLSAMDCSVQLFLTPLRRSHHLKLSRNCW